MAKKTTDPVYDESKIKTLSSLEHIRLRTGMYIGRTGDGSHYEDGIYILLKEVIDNAIDEYIMGHGKKVDITVEDGVVSVRDYGRGIPHGKLVDCVSTINTGAKYNDEVFQFSVGLNGVGTKAVNALAATFTVRSYREGRYAEAVFEKGKLVAENTGKAEGEPDGTFVNFLPDDGIFGDFNFKDEHIIRRLKLYTYLNAGLMLRFNGQAFMSQGGLLDLVREETDDEAVYEPMHFRSKMLEIAFTHCQRFNETHFSFVNGQYTSDGGTHLSAFREGMLKAVNEFSKKKYEGDDVREGMVGAVAIRLKDPIFESQTKNKLGNSEIRGELVNQVKEAVLSMLHRNPEVAEKLMLKVADTERLRKELQGVKKLARERAKAISLRIPQLKDCKMHYDLKREKGHESMIFITEGQSASGSIVSCRDVTTQAIYTLKGKPMNVCDLKREGIYKNDELYNLMRSLNIEDSVDYLRYQRIILATDADVDGLHIRNLMITFFLRFFEPLVLRQHLFILETPLFRARTKKETIYCYSEKERDKATAKLGKGCEVTRFKGLGEISPHEFKQFIGPDMRLSPVEVDSTHVVGDLLDFYMGKNTPERRSYIMDYLVVDEEA